MVRETDRILDQLERGVEQIMVALPVNITAELIERTPVLTGFARASWVPSIGTPLTDGDDPLDEAARRAAVPSAVSRQGAATAALASYQLERGSVFIANNTSYIGILNEGSSTQAPAGFIQQSIVRGIRSLDGFRFVP